MSVPHPARRAVHGSSGGRSLGCAQRHASAEVEDRRAHVRSGQVELGADCRELQAGVIGGGVAGGSAPRAHFAPAIVAASASNTGYVSAATIGSVTGTIVTVGSSCMCSQPGAASVAPTDRQRCPFPSAEASI